MSFVKVTGTNFVRDTGSMCLSNVDQNAKDEYYNKVKMITSQKQQINMINSEISEMKNDINTIKHLLLQLTNKN
jgi:septal ring factor EnvC (AmiA/AmiB activator)